MKPMLDARRPSALSEAAVAAIGAVRAHAFRSCLTAVGVVIGVASVILVVSLVQGFANSVTSQFKGLGANAVVVYPMPSLKQRMQGRMPRVTIEDLAAVQHEVPDIADVTPVLVMGQLSEPVEFSGVTEETTMYGTTAAFADDGQFYPAAGRFISRSDDQFHRRVCVIGHSLLKKLNLPADPLGKLVSIRDESYRIVGVLNEKGDIAGVDQDNLVVIPYGTASSILGDSAESNLQIRLNVSSIDLLEGTAARIERVLRRTHHITDKAEDDFKVQTASQLADSMESLFDSISLLLSGIVGISLLVGGIGIMNVMLVSVTERTREIGICMSLGATARDVLLQFLLEAMLISVVGGIAGAILGLLGAQVVSVFIPTFGSIAVPLWPIALALGVSTLTGVVFGIIPAAKAAALNPIDALRYE
jgi:putative ABC transport system permease protein